MQSEVTLPPSLFQGQSATLLVDVFNNLVWRESFNMFASPIVIITMPLIVSLLP